MKIPQYSILIVEDCRENLTMLSKILSQKGYQVYAALDGQTALDVALREQPDLVLLDVLLPDMTGYEVCHRLRTDDTTTHIPILFISALDEVMNIVKGFEVGGVDYIIKPFQAEEILARVQTHLELRGAQQRLQNNNIRLQKEIHERKYAQSILQQRNQQLSLLNRVGQVFGSSLELSHVLKMVLGEIQALFNVDSTSLWLLVPEMGELVCMQATGPGSESVTDWRLAVGQGIAGWAAQHGESVIVADTLNDERHFKGVDKSTHIPIRSMMSIPLLVKGDVIGVLSLVDPQVGRFTQNDLIMLEPVAASAAIAIDNARLYTTAQQEITERKRAEKALLDAHDELQEKNSRLQELNASKDKFFSIISHDLRSPFSALLGFAHLLKENLAEYTQQELQHRVEKLYSSAERLYALLENLLTWSRIQRGALKYEPQLLDLQETLQEILDLFLSEAERKHIILTNRVDVPLVVYADYRMIEAVLRNLISNALKFTQLGGKVSVAAQPDDDWVELVVSDTGVGISQEDIAKLFRIDIQYTHIGTAGERGTGLGLILCHELVERNQGKIWVESTVGSGTQFHFTLPRRKEG